MADKDLNPSRTEDNYAACSAYQDRVNDSRHEKHEDVIVFQHRNGLYYFATVDENNQIVLRSEGYPTTGARDNGLKSVLRNREKRTRYKIREDRENFYTCLLAGNNQEIGRSCPKKSQAAAEALFPPMSAASLALRERAAAEEAAAAEAAKKVEAAKEPKEAYVPNAEREQDNYLVCSEYQERVGDSKHEKHEDVIVFQHANGLYYFATVDGNNDIALRSEGYPTTGARDNGLKSVLRNREKRTRFKIEQNRGLYFTCLTAGNNQEIGRSCPKKSEAAAMAIWPPMSAASLALRERAAAEEAAAKAEEKAKAAAATKAKTAVKKVAKNERVVDNYLKCSAYEARISDSKHPDHDDIIAFSYKNGLHYFATLDKNGEIALRSEGYKSISARENGIASVLKNGKLEKRYVVIRKGNTYFTALKAGNHQEIGRSCPKKDKAAAKWLIPGAISAGAAALGLAASAPKIADVIPPAPAPAPAPAPTPVPEPPKEKEDDYLACKEYTGRPVNDKKNLVSLFKHENGQFYFAIVDKTGKVRMRSEGFPDAKRRDEELSGALRFINDETKYERITRGKYFINVLHDETGREVGRSCASQEEVAFVPPVEKEDDYLACKEYSGRKVNDKKNRVSLFKHKNGQYYFAILDGDNKVRLRSEGFPDAKRRDEELSGALRFIDDESKYTRITQGKYHINVLHDETGREVGRSCAQKEPVPFIPLVAAAAAIPAVAAATPKPTPPPKKSAPVAAAAAVGAGAAAAATSAAAVPPAAAAAKGGCAPWMWIAGLLLALALLYFLLPQGCNGLGCNEAKAPAVASPAIEAPAEKPVTAPLPVEAPEPVPEPEPVAAAPTCNCNSLTHPVFDIPNKKPNNITRLGRAPEFGNSHDLSPAQFFEKLQRRAANSTADRKFLNGIAKAMGYSDFAGLSADKFSSVTLERGTTGNLGSTPRHKTIYATLNTSGRDLEAFRIQAANGCHLHFMKTCGNHMFFCPKE